MPRLAARKQRSHSGTLPARKRRARLSSVRCLANPASLTAIPHLDSHHSGSRITFCDAKAHLHWPRLWSRFLDFSQCESDRAAVRRVSSALVDRVNLPVSPANMGRNSSPSTSSCASVCRRASSAPRTPNRSRSPIVSCCSCLTPNRLSRLELGKRSTNWNGINLPSRRAAFGTTVCARLLHFRWGTCLRRLGQSPAAGSEQMTEWAEGEDDPESYEIPKLEQDLPECLKAQTATDSLPSLATFPTLEEPWLRELVHTAIELDRGISHLVERPFNSTKNGWNENVATTLSIHLCLPSSCISVPEMPSWPASMTNANTGARKHRSPTSSFPCNPKISAEQERQALAVLCGRLMRCPGTQALRIQNLIDECVGETIMRFSIDVGLGEPGSEALPCCLCRYRNDHGNRVMATVHGSSANRHFNGAPAAGVPDTVFGTGRLLRELTKQLGTSMPGWRIWHRHSVIARTPELIAWCGRRHAVRPMFFRTRLGTGRMFAARLFPHPALLFAVRDVCAIRASATGKQKAGSQYQAGSSALLEHRPRRKKCGQPCVFLLRVGCFHPHLAAGVLSERIHSSRRGRPLNHQKGRYHGIVEEPGREEALPTFGTHRNGNSTGLPEKP